tara:strand:- start:6732 stop:6983 length:252 start_codon:yes stop_codon:yes gene_type:complete
MTHYPSANLNKDLPIVPVKGGKWSVGDWLVMLLGSLIVIIFSVLFWEWVLVVMIATFVAFPNNIIMFFRELIAPQRNPFAAKE